MKHPREEVHEMENTVEMHACICPKFEKTFSILGKKWSGLIIEVLLTGDHRFKEIAEEIPGVSDRVLVERLKELEDEGIVIRKELADGPIRILYGLTEKGKNLEPAMIEIQRWSNQWITI